MYVSITYKNIKTIMIEIKVYEKKIISKLGFYAIQYPASATHIV